MAQKAIREADGKKMMARFLPKFNGGHIAIEDKFLSIQKDTDLDSLTKTNPWLNTEKLVVKPDQLIKRRGKNNLILLNAGWQDVQNWIKDHRSKTLTIGNVSGNLESFIVEPFVQHEQQDEYYLALLSNRNGDEILFHHEGGINVGDVDAKAKRLEVPTGLTITTDQIEDALLENVQAGRKALIAEFIQTLHRFYADLHFTYLEINPFIVKDEKVIPLDLAARLDDTAEFQCCDQWELSGFPSPFGRSMSEEEAYISDLDSKTGASLKLTLLNPAGRIWTMVAGGGASVIYADTITDLGYMHEMANYGEYSGNPNEEFTYLYAKTMLDLITRQPHPDGKVLLIGGGIANFTDVAKTFKGIERALRDFGGMLKDQNVKIFVRRGGPNYKKGLQNIRELGEELELNLQVFGPETHMTRIVSLAIKELEK